MKKFIITLVLIALINTINGQIIQVAESIKDEMVELKPTESNIVDINSRLEIKVNKELLIKKVSRSSGINQDFLAQVEKLNYILFNQIEILKKLQTNIENLSQYEKIKTLGEYSILMNTFLAKLRESDNEEFREAVNNYFTSYISLRKKKAIDTIVYPNPQTYSIKKLTEEADVLLKMMAKSDDFQKIQFQLLASLNTGSGYPVKVHIENFDNYAEGEYYEVPRWVTTFSDSDIAEFEKTKELANMANTMLDYDLDNLETLLRDNFQSIVCIQDVLITIEALYENRNSIFESEQQLEVAETFLKNIQSEFVEVNNILSNLNITNQDENVLVLFNNYQKIFLDVAGSFTNTIETLKSDNSSLIESLPSEISDLINQVDQCTVTLKNDIETIEAVVNVVSNMLGPFKKTADIADEVSDKVLSFSVDELPDLGYLNLKTAGTRGNGDEIVIRLKIVNEEDKEKNMPGETIEMRTFVLQQINIYSISKVTLILAVPFPDSKVELLKKNRVQFAPSGSLLFKFGSRKLKAWNFISPGAGFNISTPDFNLDGTPDVGLGVIATVLKDIISFGWSYNTTTSSQYWFVGLSIPITLPGLPINTVQSSNMINLDCK
jgi:hypothetical protein